MRKQLETELLFSDDAPSGYSSVFADGDSTVNLGTVLNQAGSELALRHGAGSPRTSEASAPKSTRLHGNLSPAEIEFNEDGNVAFGAAAWTAVGDPALDIARLMAHVLVISTHRRSCIMLSDVAGSLHSGYFRSIAPGEKRPLANRTGPLTTAFLKELAGTAPYLQPQMREDLQEFAHFWLARRDYTLGQVWSALWTAIDMGFHDSQIDWRRTPDRPTKWRRTDRDS
jgi:hypothetical protein